MERRHFIDHETVTHYSFGSWEHLGRMGIDSDILMFHPAEVVSTDMEGPQFAFYPVWDLLDNIKMNCEGHFPLWYEDAALLVRYAAIPAGDYVEIGTGYGTSAIVVAYYKEVGDIHCIDPLDGYYGRHGTIDPDLSPSVVIRNLKKYNLYDKVRLHMQKHPPLPSELEEHRFVSAFIDATHDYKNVWLVFESLEDRVDKYILFHDIDNKHVRKAYEEIITGSEWDEIERSERTGVIRRE